MPAIDQRIADMETKLKQLKARQQQIVARKRTIESRQARKDDTRKKILIGSAILAQIEHGDYEQTKLNALLDRFLTRPDDRALFDLPAPASNANQPTATPPIPSAAAPSTPPTRFTYNPVADPKKLF